MKTRASNLVSACVVAGYLVLSPAAAHASPGDGPGALALSSSSETPDSAISVHLLALPSAGLVAAYERLLPGRDWSVIALAGARVSASGDYASRALSAGLGLRYWFTGRTLRSRLADQTLVGLYLGAGLSLMHTAVRARAIDSMPERTVGASLIVSESIDLGYRFALWRRVEVTPSIGLGVRTEIDTHGVLPSATRGTFTVGLTLGWLL